MKTTITKILFSLTLLLLINNTANASTNPLMVAPPVNDLIVNAINLNLGPVPYSKANVNFPEATFQGDGGPMGGCNIISEGIWYKFTATADGSVTAFIQTASNPLTNFYTAPNENVTSGTELTYVNQASNPCDLNNFASIETTAGTVYYIFMRNLVISNVAINVSNAFAPPANDHITNAINLNGLEDYNDPDIHFLMATSTDDGGQDGCSTENSGGVWYKFTAPIDGQVVAGIGINPNNGAIIFYSAPNENAATGGELTYVNQPSNVCGLGNLSSIIAVAGTSYYIFAGTNEPKATVSINLAGILGTSENTFENFKYYPNPVINEINLNAKSVIDEVAIYNLLGQKVFSEKIGANKSTINLSFLKTGMYIITVSSEGNTASYKIVKE